MNTLITILAWTSFLVCGLVILIGLAKIVSHLYQNHYSYTKEVLTVQPVFFLWLAGAIWPVVYYFVK